MMPESMTVGIVLERRVIQQPWEAINWSVNDVILGGGPDDGWRELLRSDDRCCFFAGNLTLILHPDEVLSYRYNLESATPVVYVILRPAETPYGMAPFLATICPVEAQDYMDSGDEVVEAVTMAEPLAAWVWDFVNRHPVRESFAKRKRTPKSGDGASQERRGAGRG